MNDDDDDDDDDDFFHLTQSTGDSGATSPNLQGTVEIKNKLKNLTDDGQ